MNNLSLYFLLFGQNLAFAITSKIVLSNILFWMVASKFKEKDQEEGKS